MSFNIDVAAEKYGFVLDGLGAHTGRTIMSVDIQRLFSFCEVSSEIEDYKNAILEKNILLKKTGAARKESFFRLRRMYGLDLKNNLFLIFRNLWEQEFENKELLILLFAISRDPILRLSSSLIINTHPGIILKSSDFSRVIEDEFSGDLTKTSIASIGRNLGSTWTQSGHLKGRSNKERAKVSGNPIIVAFALLLGHLAGNRGEKLFYTPWIKLLDTSQHQLHSYAQVASQQGWLKYKKIGQITEISFDYLLEGEGHE